MKRILLILLAVSLCACGCKTTKNSADKPEAAPVASTSDNDKPAYKLTETKWMLTHINTQEIGDCPESPYMVFTGDRISGNLGCNSFFGTFYANKNGKIDIEYTGSTQKLCSEMQVERDFISALKVDKKSYVITGDLLIIRGEKMMEDGSKREMEVLRFKAEEK